MKKQELQKLSLFSVAGILSDFNKLFNNELIGTYGMIDLLDEKGNPTNEFSPYYSFLSYIRSVYYLSDVLTKITEYNLEDDLKPQFVNMLISACFDVQNAANDFINTWNDRTPERELDERIIGILNITKGNDVSKIIDDDFNYLQQHGVDLTKAKHSTSMVTHVNTVDQVADFSSMIKQYTSIEYDPKNNFRENENRVVHHAKGKSSRLNNDYTLELFFAGSGNAQLAKYYKGYTGRDEYVPVAEAEIQSENAMVRDINKKYKIDWSNYEKGCAAYREALDKEYGKYMYADPDGVLYSQPLFGTKPVVGVRKRVDGTRTRINLSGPMGGALIKPGAIDSGDYNITKLTSYALQQADEWLHNVYLNFKEKKRKGETNFPKVNIYMKGHSRGAVACNETSAAINYLLNTKYKEMKDIVHISTHLLDPVPGADHMIKYQSLDHTQKLIERGYSHKYNLRGLSASPEEAARNDSTVFYSLHSNHNIGFAPESIKGASRVFLTCMNHDISLYDVVGDHKRGFIDAKTGHEYRGSGFEDHPKGLFLVDEYKNIVEVKNSHEAHKLIQAIYDKQGWWERFSQRIRHSRINDLIDDWFSVHPDTITKNDVRYKADTEIKDALNALGRVVKSTKSSDENRQIANLEGALSRICATVIINKKFMDKVSADKTAWKESSTKKYEKDYQKLMDGNTIEKLEKDLVFKSFINTLTPDDLQSIYENRDNPSIDSISSRYDQYKAAIKNKTNVKSKKAASSEKKKPIPEPSQERQTLLRAAEEKAPDFSAELARSDFSAFSK